MNSRWYFAVLAFCSNEIIMAEDCPVQIHLIGFPPEYSSEVDTHIHNYFSWLLGDCSSAIEYLKKIDKVNRYTASGS